MATTTFRAIGVSSSAQPATAGDVVEASPRAELTKEAKGAKAPFTATVKFVEIGEKQTVVLFQKTFEVTDRDELTTLCTEILEGLKTRHEDAQRAIAINDITLAEVVSE